MIAEERLRGRIDQIEKIIYFDDAEASQLNLWDKHIQSCCDAVNAITEQLGLKYPAYV